MGDGVDFDAFELAWRDSDWSALVRTTLFISNIVSPVSATELLELIQTSQLWLLSSGSCRFQVVAELADSLGNTHRPDLELLQCVAQAICNSAIWSALGLAIECENIQHEPVHREAPNLYFLFHHADNSAGLLCPSQTPTAYLEGLECRFQFRPKAKAQKRHAPASQKCPAPDLVAVDNFGYRAGSLDYELTILELLSRGLQSTGEDSFTTVTNASTPGNSAARKQSGIIDTALFQVFGIKKRYWGLRLKRFGDPRSLLEVAPAVLNAKYIQTMRSHHHQFSTIAATLVDSIHAQSPSLRHKIARLLTNQQNHRGRESSFEDTICHDVAYNNVTQKLWALLLSKLDVDIGTKKKNLSMEDLQGESSYLEIQHTGNTCQLDDEGAEFEMIEHTGTGNAHPACLSSPNTDNEFFDDYSSSPFMETSYFDHPLTDEDEVANEQEVNGQFGGGYAEFGQSIPYDDSLNEWCDDESAQEFSPNDYLEDDWSYLDLQDLPRPSGTYDENSLLF